MSTSEILEEILDLEFEVAEGEMSCNLFEELGLIEEGNGRAIANVLDTLDDDATEKKRMLQ